MVEKVQTENQPKIIKERFEFILTVNGNIACQRYFKINGYNEKSANSAQLVEAIDYCVSLINKNIRDKANIYNYLTAPQVYKNREEMESHVASAKLDVPSFIILSDENKVLVWDGVNTNGYEKSFNVSDYGHPEDANGECILKFRFLDNGREVKSVTWDASNNPRFVKNNIDLSNSRNRFDPNNSPIEYFIVREFNAGRKDIIPEIIRTICVACSSEGMEYDSVLEYGDKKYPVSVKGAYEEYVRGFEKAVSKKTKAYFSGR